MNWDFVFKKAAAWIKEAGLKIEDSFQSTLHVETKSNRNDIVTNVDKEIERFFITKISETFPGHRILGEEGQASPVDQLKGVVWIIDPIDGTINYVHQQRNFAISIGIYENGVGKIGLIYDVVHRELYYALKGRGAFFNDRPLKKLNETPLEDAIIGINATWVAGSKRIDPSILGTLVRDIRGTRSYGSAALEIAFVAAGRLDGYITLRLSPWDFAAGLVIIEEVGGIATDLRGKPINLLGQNSILIAKPGLHEKILSGYLKNGNW